MKRIFKLCLIAAATACAACTYTNVVEPTETAIGENLSVTTGTIIVRVDEFKVQEGQISVALFDEAGYKGGAPLRGQNADVTGENVTLNFEGLPAGEYGIKMYHDADENGKMNTNAFGMPTESFAFSNNATGTMGPAKWEKAKFTVTEAGAVQLISLN